MDESQIEDCLGSPATLAGLLSHELPGCQDTFCRNQAPVSIPAERAEVGRSWFAARLSGDQPKRVHLRYVPIDLLFLPSDPSVCPLRPLQLGFSSPSTG